MFTIYHGILFIAIAVAACAFGYRIGYITGEDDAYRKADDYYRTQNQKRG